MIDAVTHPMCPPHASLAVAVAVREDGHGHHDLLVLSESRLESLRAAQHQEWRALLLVGVADLARLLRSEWAGVRV